MDRLWMAAKAFEKLLDVQYTIILGRKGKQSGITLAFSTHDFHHLMGLNKLKDIRIAQQARESVFQEILNGTITYETISKSRYLGDIENRFPSMIKIESLLDSEHLVFQYIPKKNPTSSIIADYLLSAQLWGTDIYIFINKCKNSPQFFCRSSFPREERDYTIGQPKYTVLFKEKVDLNTGSGIVLFSHPNYEHSESPNEQNCPEDAE